MHVDVRGPARIPAGKNAGERDLPGGIGHLPAAQEVYAGVVGGLHARAAVLRIVALGVAVPDVDQRASQGRAAGVAVRNGNVDGQRVARFTVRDVVAHVGRRRVRGKGPFGFRGGHGAAARTGRAGGPGGARGAGSGRNAVVLAAS